VSGRGPIPKDPRRKVDKRGARLPKPAAKIVATLAAPAAPADLPRDLVPVWQGILEELDSRGSMPAAFRPVDVVLVRVLLDAIHVHTLARADIARQGITVEGRWGPTPNPALRTQRDAAATILRLAGELGLSPAARTRLGLLALAGVSILQSLHDDLAGKVAAAVLADATKRRRRKPAAE